MAQPEAIRIVDLDKINSLKEAMAEGQAPEVVNSLIKEKHAMIALNNKHQRALGMVGMPATTRMTSWIESIPFLAGVKFVLVDAIPAGYSLAGIGKGVISIYRWIRG